MPIDGGMWQNVFEVTLQVQSWSWKLDLERDTIMEPIWVSQIHKFWKICNADSSGTVKMQMSSVKIMFGRVLFLSVYFLWIMYSTYIYF